MCQYRYYYYAGCRHQRTVLSKYCANATAIAPAPPQAQHQQQEQHDPTTPADSDSTGDEVSAQGELANAVTPTSSVPSSSPDTSTTYDSHISHRQFPSPSIPQLNSNVASLQLQHVTRQLSDTEWDDMATLPVLAKSSWREPHQLILGAPALARSDHSWVVVDLDQQSRDGSDCSLRHESKEQRHGEITTHGCVDMKTQLKRCEEEVLRLRGLVKNREIVAANRESQQGSVEGPGSTQTGARPQTAGESNFSPAALLQLQHGQAQLLQHCMTNVAELDAPVAPLCAGDFPGLRDTEDKHLTEHDRHAVARKLSYADMASQHLKTAAEALPTGPTHSRTASAVPTTMKASAIPLPVATPGSGPASTLKKTASKKASPRFAQPTAAFSRRADETTRKDGSTTVGNKNSLVKPASISVAGCRQQKRKSLPGDWLASPPERTGTPNPAAGLDQAAGHAALQLQTSGSRGESTLRKKTSTYMSPTKAATLRTKAIIGHETSISPSPRLQRNFLTLDTTLVSSIAAGSQKSSPASPETTIETEMNVDRALRARSRNAELSGVVTRRRSTITTALPHSRKLPANTSVADLLAEQARAAGLPMVANATIQRRGSHGHLLIPIKAKLDSIGILRNDPHVANVRRDSRLLSPISQKSGPELFSPVTHTVQPAQATLPELPRAHAEVSPPMAPPIVKRAVPPHVRAAMREAAARQAAAAAGDAQVAKTPLLRATAKEFKPMLASPQQEPQPVLTPVQTAPSESPQAQGLDLAADNAPRTASRLWPIIPAQVDMSVSEDDAARFYNVEEWAAMPFVRRRQILERRSQLRGGFGGYQNHSENRRGVINGNYSNSAAPYMLPDLSETCPDIFGPTPIGAHAPQAAAPRLDSSGKPVNGYLFSPYASNASPRLTSPHTSDLLPRSWTVGSEQSRQVYGWKGGDGREIKFIGHGPDAEREPGYGGRFNYQRRGSNMGRGPRMIGMDGEDGSPELPLAPRSRRHWAQLAGHAKQPCDNMEIVDATEQMPALLGQSLFGHCTDCGIDSQQSLPSVVA